MAKRQLTTWIIKHYERGIFIGVEYGTPQFDNWLKKNKLKIHHYLSSDEALAVLGYMRNLHPIYFDKCFIKRIDPCV